MNQTGVWFRRVFFAGALLAGIATRGSGASLEIDLGGGLGYVRLRALPADGVVVAANRAPALVVDLRYAEAEKAAATDFLADLRRRATTRKPIFVLANHATAPELLRAISAVGRGTGIAVIGIAAPGFTPDVAVRVTAEDEKQAYAALDAGTGTAKLLADHPGKVRHDEASLTRGRSAEPTAETAGETPGGSGPAVRTGPPVDATLQRALHLHRSLQALRKL